MITFDTVLTLSIGGIVGYIVREVIGHKLAITRTLETIKITEFNKAAAEFRIAFVDVVFILRKSERFGGHDTRNILNETALTVHEKAKIRFEPFLSSSALESFNIAWNNYRNYHNNYLKDKPLVLSDSQDVGQYCGNSSKEMSRDCLNHIDNLLSFAKPKT